MSPVLPSFEVVARRRPVDLVQPTGGAPGSLPPAPYAAATTPVTGSPSAARCVGLASGGTSLTARLDGRVVSLEVTHAGATERHTSRRHGRTQGAASLGVSLTGPVLTAWTLEKDGWVARAQVDLAAPGSDTARDGLDVHDEAWLADLHPVGQPDRPDRPGDDDPGVTAGAFGQLGLRDLRVVSHADGSAYVEDGLLLLTGTSAGPGGFRTGHTSVWSLDPEALDLSHRGDLYFRRPDVAGVYGDHATHLLRDGDRWRCATSTWGDFDTHRHPVITTTIGTSTDDLTRGTHVLDVEPLVLPTTGITSVGTWDPHLVRVGEPEPGWLVTYVSAREFFAFHPVVASGADLEHLTLRAAAEDRVATEGPTLTWLADAWHVTASDGRDGPRGQREAYPVFDLDLEEVATIDAAYPTNIPWPTLAPTDDGWLMIGFDGSRSGGQLLGYGTHGAVVLQRARRA